MGVQLEYINHLLQFLKTFPIMLALCSMLSVTYYAQNYAGIIGWSLIIMLNIIQAWLLKLLHPSCSISITMQ